VLAKCSHTLYALRVLRHLGLCDAGLQTVFQSVIVAKAAVCLASLKRIHDCRWPPTSQRISTQEQAM